DYLIRVTQACPRATTLRQMAERWLYEHKIVRPGRTTVQEILSAAREIALQRVYDTLAGSLSPNQQAQIDALLVVSPAPADTEPPLAAGSPLRSRLEQFKALPRRESPEAMLALTQQLTELGSLGLATHPDLARVHPATRRLLASWGYRYDAWSLRRFALCKRQAIVLCFLQAVLAETTDAIIEMQDKF